MDRFDSLPATLITPQFVETSDAEEQNLLSETSRRDFWYSSSTSRLTISLENLRSPSLEPNFPPENRSKSESPGPNDQISPVLSQSSSVGMGVSKSSSSSPTQLDNEEFPRSLRPRTRLQVQPYTIEKRRYETSLRRRGQNDAIVHVKDLRTSEAPLGDNISQREDRDSPSYNTPSPPARLLKLPNSIPQSPLSPSTSPSSFVPTSPFTQTPPSSSTLPLASPPHTRSVPNPISRAPAAKTGGTRTKFLVLEHAMTHDQTPLERRGGYDPMLPGKMTNNKSNRHRSLHAPQISPSDEGSEEEQPLREIRPSARRRRRDASLSQRNFIAASSVEDAMIPRERRMSGFPRRREVMKPEASLHHLRERSAAHDSQALPSTMAEPQTTASLRGFYIFQRARPSFAPSKSSNRPETLENLLSHRLESTPEAVPTSNLDRPVDPGLPQSETRSEVPAFLELDLCIPSLDQSIHRLDSPYISEGTRLVQLLARLPPPPRLWRTTDLDVSLSNRKDAPGFSLQWKHAVERLVSWSEEDTMEFFAAMELISDLGRTLTWICYDDPNIVSVLRQDLIPALEVCLTRVKRWSSDNASLSQASGYRYVWVYWLAIEQAYRLMLAANDDWTTGHFINAFLTQAVDALLRIGFSSIVDDLNNHQPIRNNVADVWVCIIHLLQAPGFKKHPGIWSLVINIVQRASWLPSDPLGRSEVIWKAAFGITALSQFSPSGRLLQAPLLAAAWPLVEAATSPIFFGIDRDGSTGASVLEERDLYLRGILGRCLLLRLRWRWDLSDALDVLHCLGHIFRSRDFCGLHGESCGFPPFLTQFGQFSLVEVFDPDDAGYDIFLKLVVLAISDLRSSPSHGAENGVKKLMSTLTPVSTTNFTPSSPPASERHLAKLYNLYSSILTAAHVDPLGAQGFTRRLRQAFIVSNFQTADMMSRSVIVRAVGLFCTEALRKGYPLVNIISWWEEILAQVLLFFNDDAISAPLLMRSVLESMLSTFQTGLQHRQRQFLQHRLLHSTFIAKILDVRHPFQPKEAILSLINVYIDLFAFTVTPSPVYDEASLGATLRVAILKRDENDASHDSEWLSTAKALVPISKALHHLINSHFSPQNKVLYVTRGDNEEEWFEWIECWARCASILVHANISTWDAYIEMGPESWTRIGSPVVGLHFMYHVLDVDPVAYQSLKGCFIAIWAQSLILPRWSIQHLFTATLFCIDRLAHPFLRDIPCGNYDNHCNFGFSADSLAILRWQMLDAFITNIAQFLRQAEGTNPSTEIRMLCELGRSLMRALIDTVSAQFFAATNHVEQLRRLIDSIQRAGILPAREFAQRTTGIEYR